MTRLLALTCVFLLTLINLGGLVPNEDPHAGAVAAAPMAGAEKTPVMAGHAVPFVELQRLVRLRLSRPFKPHAPVPLVECNAEFP